MHSHIAFDCYSPKSGIELDGSSDGAIFGGGGGGGRIGWHDELETTGGRNTTFVESRPLDDAANDFNSIERHSIKLLIFELWTSINQQYQHSLQDSDSASKCKKLKLVKPSNFDFNWRRLIPYISCSRRAGLIIFSLWDTWEISTQLRQVAYALIFISEIFLRDDIISALNGRDD